MMVSNTAYIIIDWGTTNFRAFALNHEDELIDTKSLSKGLLQISDGAFAESLQVILEDWIEDYKPLPIYMAGMVGSAKGWHQVEYSQTPASLNSIDDKAFRFTLPWQAPAVIFAGVSHMNDEEQPDVMRGDEIQIFGLSIIQNAANFSAILPGTHSKHISYEQNNIASFSSFMTGEMFSILLSHSLLGKEVPVTNGFQTDVFLKGLNDVQNGKLTNKLFLNWSKRLFGQLKVAEVADYLSGMLIGYELQNVNANFVYIIGSQGLSQRYALACEALSIQAKIVDGNACFLAGIIALKNRN